MEKVKILAIVGSLRKDSYNLQLARKAQEILADRAEIKILDYSDVPFMNEDIEFPAPAPVKRVREEVKKADGIWFFTPEYNHSFTGVLKNLIDWLSRPISDTEPQVLIRKPAAISGVSLGMCGTSIAQDQLAMLLSYLDMDIMNQPRLTIPRAYEKLDSEGKFILGDSLPFLQKQADAFYNYILRRK